MPYPKVIDSPHYHIWSDALHGRELARQAPNDWDCGTYVRWALVSAWTTLETVCEHVLGATGIGFRFKDHLDEAVQKAGLAALKWDKGVWQQVLDLNKQRKMCVHLTVPTRLLFAEETVASNAIQVVRDAITELYGHAGKKPPSWLADDSDPGWAGRAGNNSIGHLTVGRAGLDPDAPDAVKISYVYKGREHDANWLYPEEDVEAAIADLLSQMNVPISAIRLYRGNVLIEDRPLKMRGA